MQSSSTRLPEIDRWQLALECAEDGLWDWNVETDEVYFSPRWKAMLGFRDHELGGHYSEWKSRVHPEDLESSLQKVQEHIEGHADTYINEHRLLHKDGSYRWILARGKVAARDADGRPLRIVGTQTDITARKELEQNRDRLEDELWSAFEHAANGMALVSAKGNLLRVNESFSRITGYSTQELHRLTFQEITHPDDLDRDVDYLRRMIAGEIKFYEMDKRYIHKGGHYVWIHLSVSMVPKADGSPKFFVSQIRDISAQKKYEVELHEARERAEAADRAKSSFLAMMSHEIRTPMNAIIGYTDLLADSGLENEQRDFLNTITSHGELLLNLINDILDFSKIEAGELNVETRPFNLRTTLQETVDLLRPRASEKRIDLLEHYDEALPQVILGDEFRLRQVLINLLGNSVKFTQEGQINLQVGCDRTNGQVDQLVFTVTDTGIGMSPAQMEQLFKPFSQADASVSRRFGGTGLGLAICRKLIEAMGGEIGATSEEGAGSTFEFRLPLNVAQAELAEPVQASAHPSNLQGRRALLLDHQGSLRRVLSHQLRRLGILVGEHATVASLEEAYRKERPDLIIYELPEEDENANALDPLRDPSGKLAVPLILVSSHSCPSALRGQKVGALHKPIRQSQLLDVLMETFAACDPRLTATEACFAERYPGSILVVEDNPANRDVLERQLTNMGYTPDSVEDGEACLRALREKRYDLVLMDLQMPRLNGLDTTRRIRESEARIMREAPLKIEPLKIAAVTADAIKGDRERALDAGMDDYVAKPVRPHCLRDLLRRML